MAIYVLMCRADQEVRVPICYSQTYSAVEKLAVECNDIYKQLPPGEVWPSWPADHWAFQFLQYIVYGNDKPFYIIQVRHAPELLEI